MLLLLGAFFAGLITVFAPCIFALLPVIVGGSITGNVDDKRRPFIIATSLAASLVVFTLLLKATTLFIDVLPAVITYISGGIIVGLGLVMLFPQLYERVILYFNLQAKSQRLLGKSSGKGAVIGAIITGAALGPVFSSCSPVYAYLIATVLPVNFGLAMLYISAYVIGLSIMLLLIGFLGQKLVRKIRFAANPRGWFQRIVAVVFILVGLMIITGYDKKFQTYISQHTPFDFDGLSAQLIPEQDQQTNDEILNVVYPYKAPELRRIDSWINSNPQKIADLKGKVVLVDFWTYSCINCIRTQPYLKEWYSRYKDSGLEIIGVHAPEFAFEKVKTNVDDAVRKAGIRYPVALDNNFSTWRAYKNHYWPSSYLIDKEGNVRRTHKGEGAYKETEQAIRQLLAEDNGVVPAASSSLPQAKMGNNRQTPEIYLGADRASNYVGTPPVAQGEYTFRAIQTLPTVNNWTLGGVWNVGNEGITAVSGSMIKIRVAAKEVFLVTGSNVKGLIGVKLDNAPVTQFAGADVKNSQLNVSAAQLYKVVRTNSFDSDMTIELTVPAGVQLNTFTFGS